MNYISIHEFAYLVGKTVPQIRYLIERGNSVSRLPAVKIDRHYMIRKQYLYTFQFVESGRHKNPLIYHYKDNEGLVVCNECSNGNRCPMLDAEGYYIHDTDKKKEGEK